MKKATLFSLLSIFILIFAVSFNAPATVKNTVTKDIVIVDDSTAKANAKCDHTGPKSNCTTTKKDCKSDCSSKCASKSAACCSKKPSKGCCKPKKK